jgi:hypothetical protein
MGPKLWLLFPIWLTGAAVWYLVQHRPLKQGHARLVAVSAVVLLILVKRLEFQEALDREARDWATEIVGFSLRHSQWFLGDYLVGSLAAMLIYGVATADVRMPSALQRVVLAASGVSFSLYLTHYPLLHLFGGILPDHGWAAVLLALAGAVGFGLVFEPLGRRLYRLGVPLRWSPAR